MRFSLENSFDQFEFRDAQVLSWTGQGSIQIEVAAAIGKATNPLNEEYVDRYIETLQIRLINAKISSMYKEGYKYYDANDVLQTEVPDQEILPVQQDAILKKFSSAKSYLFRVEQCKDSKESAYQYCFYVDVEDADSSEFEPTGETYLITVQFEKSVQEWEYFQNRVMY